MKKERKERDMQEDLASRAVAEVEKMEEAGLEKEGHSIVLEHARSSEQQEDEEQKKRSLEESLGEKMKNEKSAGESCEKGSISSEKPESKEDSRAEDASPGERYAGGKLEEAASKDGEDLSKFDVHFFLGVLDECMFLYVAFLCGSQAKSFLLGLGVYFLMELKRVVVAACVGDGSGPVPFSRLEHDDKAVRACYKRSVWLDSLLTLGCCVAVKMGWVALG